MAHEIEIAADGTASFFSGEGKTAWHGLGTVVEGTLTAAEALKTAGLDWRVDLKPSFYQDDDGNFVPIADRFATVRDTDGRAFEVVGSDYTVFQNLESFSFFDAVTGKNGEAHYTTAGALAGGRKVFLTAKIGDTFTVAGGDAHDLYLIISNTHDGKQAFTAMVSAVRVVCANTMTLASQSAKSRWSLRHTTSLSGQVQQARESLNLAYKYEAAFQAEVEALLAVDVNMDQFLDIATDLLPDQKRAKTRHLDDLAGAWLHETTPVDSTARGNGWSAINASTYWTDHIKPSRSAEALFKSVNGGFAETFRNSMRDRVLALA